MPWMGGGVYVPEPAFEDGRAGAAFREADFAGRAGFFVAAFTAFFAVFFGGFFMARTLYQTAEGRPRLRSDPTARACDRPAAGADDRARRGSHTRRRTSHRPRRCSRRAGRPSAPAPTAAATP